LRVCVEDGSLIVDANDPLVAPKVYWPDGRVELWGQVRQVKGRR